LEYYGGGALCAADEAGEVDIGGDAGGADVGADVDVDGVDGDDDVVDVVDCVVNDERFLKLGLMLRRKTVSGWSFEKELHCSCYGRMMQMVCSKMVGHDKEHDMALLAREDSIVDCLLAAHFENARY